MNLSNVEDVWISHDCGRCPYGKTRKRLKGGGFECDSPESYECKDGGYKTRVVISICGDLRDRLKETTEKEFNAFKNYIEKEYLIRNYSVDIDGD